MTLNLHTNSIYNNNSNLLNEPTQRTFLSHLDTYLKYTSNSEYNSNLNINNFILKQKSIKKNLYNNYNNDYNYNNKNSFSFSCTNTYSTYNDANEICKNILTIKNFVPRAIPKNNKFN